MDKRLLNVKEAAEYLGTTPGSLYHTFRTLPLPFLKWGKGGRNIRFDVKDLDKWIEENKLNEKT